MKNIYQRVCSQCNTIFPGGPRAWYCPICRAKRIKEKNREFCQNGRKAKRPLGSVDKCLNCGSDYVVNSGLQRYCNECAPIMYKQVDRIQGLRYYHTNKDTINRIRKLKRRTFRKCPICGVDYWAVGGTLACCKEHKKEVIKQRTVRKATKTKY